MLHITLSNKDILMKHHILHFLSRSALIVLICLIPSYELLSSDKRSIKKSDIEYCKKLSSFLSYTPSYPISYLPGQALLLVTSARAAAMTNIVIFCDDRALVQTTSAKKLNKQ